MRKRVAITAASFTRMGSSAAGVSSILIMRGFGVNATIWTVFESPTGRFFIRVDSRPL